jgi:ATP-dependent Clp protease adaptor protein ClpS
MGVLNPAEVQQDDSDVLTNNPAKVILYNDDVHSFEEVIGQLIKATGCSTEKAEGLAWEVHTRGKAVVYTGEMSKCLKVNSVLEEIDLHTQIEI